MTKDSIDAIYDQLNIALRKVCLELSPGYLQRRNDEWIYNVNTFCFIGSTRVNLHIGASYQSVTGSSNVSADDALLNMVSKLKKGHIEVDQSGKKKRYSFDSETITFTEIKETQKA